MTSSKTSAEPTRGDLASSCRNSRGCRSGRRLCTGSTITAASSAAVLASMSRASRGSRSRGPGCSRRLAAGSRGDRERAAARPYVLRADQYLVEDAVVGAGEHRDLVAAGDGARDAHRAHHGLRARIAEAARSIPVISQKSCGDLAGERGLRADLVTRSKLASALHELRLPAEQVPAEAIHQVDVLVAVDVPESRAGAIVR